MKDAPQFLRARKFEWLQAKGLANLKINQRIFPADTGTFDGILDTKKLEIDSNELREFAHKSGLSRYFHAEYPHTKLLEYFTSVKLLKLKRDEILLDAAGGSSAEFPVGLSKYLDIGFKCLVQDARATARIYDEGLLKVEVLGGSIEKVPKASETIDVISCHHSFEHFQGGLDISFIKEALRLLKPGGRLVVVPLFLTNIYAEIWNRNPTLHFDPESESILDRSSSFPGWGPYEGFARTYSINAFERRILSILDENCKVELIEVFLDGEACPDMRFTKYQPLANANMKALYIERRA